MVVILTKRKKMGWKKKNFGLKYQHFSLKELGILVIVLLNFSKVKRKKKKKKPIVWKSSEKIINMMKPLANSIKQSTPHKGKRRNKESSGHQSDPKEQNPFFLSQVVCY
jgi:hypothetical protein